MKLLRKLLLLLPIALSLVIFSPAQDAASTQEVPAAEHHISSAEAAELFRSVDDILKFASDRTGLPILHPVKKKLATREEVAKYVEKRMKEQESTERLDHSAQALKKLGLLPRDFNLREYMLNLYKEQVEGWYDAHNKTVYLLDWVAPDVQKPVMAHELVHALQDQSYDLENWLNIRKDTTDVTGQMILDEQRAARQSIIEGQAMIVLYDYQLAAVGQTVESAPAVADAMRAAILDEDSTPMYAQAPIFLREALIFPYSYGTDFAIAVLVKRGKQAAFAGVLEHPPLDTHQIMEPAAYLSGEPQIQFHVADLEKVLGSDWHRDDFSGIGEVDLRVICRQWGGKEIAARLTPAWRGGYYMSFANKKSHKAADPPLALVLNFATAEAANEFAKLYDSALIPRYRIVQPGNSPREWITDAGLVRLYVEGTTVIALESFSASDASKLHAALVAPVPKPSEISPTPSSPGAPH